MPPGWEDLRVSALLHPESRQWDYGKLTTLFNSKYCNQILVIPLSKTRQQDAWIWHFMKNGIFSVKSVYRELQHGQPTRLGDHSWSSIWNVEVPFKVQHVV